MKSEVIGVATGRREGVHDITAACAKFAASAAGGGDGLLHVFVPHATAGLALMDAGAGRGAAPGAARAETLPGDARGRHAQGSRGHGRTHVLPALVPPFLVIPVLAGRMALGTWQSVALIDLNVDNTDRQVRLSYLG